jgi:hypothetical protein
VLTTRTTSGGAVGATVIDTIGLSHLGAASGLFGAVATGLGLLTSWLVTCVGGRKGRLPLTRTGE